MVNLTRIYTRTGDAGQTRLSDNSVAAKTDLRVHAYGEVDEANAVIGLVLAEGADELDEQIVAALALIQNELFDLGADLSTPIVASPEWEPLRITQPSIDTLEGWCDQFGDQLPSLRSFVLPGGSPTAARLHLARTTTRRAERAGWAAAELYGIDTDGGVSSLALTYLNRLSDLLFIWSRFVLTAGGSQLEREQLWVPGGERHSTPG